MQTIWIYTLLSVFIISLISLVGAFTLSIKPETLKSWLMHLVSFSAGALLGDVFLHMLPELGKAGFELKYGIYILTGILIFYALERFIYWHHSHSEHKEEVHSYVYLTQAADSLHNFIDGLIIAGSFLISNALGFATAIAVIFHEIPQEIGNFAIFIHGGWSVKKALFYNFFSALTAFAGAAVVLIFLKNFQGQPALLLSIGAASFIYIAMSDLIPELHKEKNTKTAVIQLLWFVLGIAAMWLLVLVE